LRGAVINSLSTLALSARSPLRSSTLALTFTLSLSVTLFVGAGCSKRGGEGAAGEESASSHKQSSKTGRRRGARGERGGAEARDEAVPVEAIRVKRGEISAVVSAVAVVEPTDQATVRALASGVLSALKVDEGARVKREALLARITRLGASSLLQKANDSYLKAKGDARRLKGLSERGLAPVEEYRQAKFQAQQSALDLRRLRQEAQNEKVKSPIRGVVTRRLINRGEQVSLGQALFEVMDLSALRVPLHLPDQWAPQLKEGLKVKLFNRQRALISDEARVSLVSPIVDAQSGTIKVFVEPPKGLAGLKPGLFVSAEVILDTRPDTLVAPRHVLMYRDDEPWVMLVQGEQARAVKVELGYAQGELVELKSPLQEGDLIVSFGQRGLEEGTKLKVTLKD